MLSLTPIMAEKRSLVSATDDVYEVLRAWAE